MTKYKDFSILGPEDATPSNYFQVLSPNGWDIVGEYLLTMEEAKTAIEDYINNGGLEDDNFFGPSPYKKFITNIKKP